MAGSRTEKIADIFTRTAGMLRSGALKQSEKPLWYDIYAAFPPKDVPTYERPKPEATIRQIFYPEDIIRAKFYRKYGSPGIISLFENKEDKRPNFCSAFVSVYQELEGQEETEESLMARVERELENRGIYLDRSRIPAKDNSESETVEEKLETEIAIKGADLPQDTLQKVLLSDLFEQNSRKKETSQPAKTVHQLEDDDDR